MPKEPRARFARLGDDIAPGFHIKLLGGSLSPRLAQLVSSVIYEEDEEMSTMFELTLINQADDELGRPVNWNAVLTDKAFQEGNSIELFLGYGGELKFIGHVDITKWLPHFGSSGPTTFTVKGFDGRHKMGTGNKKVGDSDKTKKGKKNKRKTSYSNLSDDAIVKKIAEKYGYIADVDSIGPGKKKLVEITANWDPKVAEEAWAQYRVSLPPGTEIPDKTKWLKQLSTTSKLVGSSAKTRIQSSDVSDWQFLRKLAAINDYDLWIDWDQLKKKYVVHFKEKKTIGEAESVFTYNGADGSLIEASPEFTIQDQVTDVEVLYMDATTRELTITSIEEMVGDGSVKISSANPGDTKVKNTIGKGARVRFSAFGQTMEAIADRPFRSKKEAKQFAINWLEKRERDLLTLRGKVIGIETLRPRQIHRIVGLGTRIDGLYRFVQVRHVMSPGQIYTCDFLAHKILSKTIEHQKAAARRKPQSKSATANKPSKPQTQPTREPKQ